MSDVQPAARDYRTTLFLPSTDFPMKAGLPQAEPKWLARWAAIDLYGRLRAQAKGRSLFVLHDGPIYANGDIHSGTGLNHILKDFVVRSRTMMGFDAPYVPGWDCHGLPIEWKVEENFRAQGRAKDEIPKDELRRACREFAAHWMGVQREQIKRLGCIGAWDNPYATMNFKAEAVIAGEAMKFVANGLLYRGFRPVMWSPIEKTALADAEVEYHEKTSPQIYVKFPVTAAKDATLLGTNLVIWTTTPWTIPANRAIAFSPNIAYGLYEVAGVEEGSLGVVGERLLLAKALADQTAKHAKLSLKHLRDVTLETMALHGAHPLKAIGFAFDVPLLAGAHVTEDAGTGFVHTAPGHGEDDYELYRAHRDFFRNVPDPFNIIAEDGSYAPGVPFFAGKRILTPEGKDGDANGAVIKELIAAGALFAKGSLRHSYPHSWRSKAPVIFRATPQWFVGIDKPFLGGKTLRELALAAIKQTKWYPPRGENRIGAMVEGRPDWVLSRQRAWGVPLAIFVNKASGEILNDAAVNARIVDIFEKEGADAWFVRPASDFLGSAFNADDYEQVHDILDVWFDSGSTHVFTVENPIDPHWPKVEQADLYLEGSDQHRGWFQSSLLESVGTRGHAPYKAVLTHGFVLDEQGRKMSKSLGNTLAPQVIAEKHGAEILRLWAASSDFTEDLRIGQDIIKANVDAYRRLRNTIRFLLANLAGFDESERIDVARMPELERFILAKLAELDGVVREGYAAYDFNRVFSTLFAFCTNELSAFYFDIRKDALYCDAKSSIRRRAARTVMDEIFRRVLTWFAPILCFTMEEAWLLRFPGEKGSVHLQAFAATPPGWANQMLIEKWNRIRQLRRVVTGALEIERAAKRIGSSLEAAPTLYVTDPADAALFANVSLAEIAITSDATVECVKDIPIAFTLTDVKGASAESAPAAGHKCARCWMVLPEVGKNPAHDDLCNRCAGAIKGRSP
jgi:isoleucyl-tRNA synthetase